MKAWLTYFTGAIFVLGSLLLAAVLMSRGLWYFGLPVWAAHLATVIYLTKRLADS